MDPYEVLGVPRQASFAEIQAAHRSKLSQHDPKGGGDARAFAQVQQAYDLILREKEAEYDRALRSRGEGDAAGEPASPATAAAVGKWANIVGGAVLGAICGAITAQYIGSEWWIGLFAGLLPGAVAGGVFGTTAK